MCGDRDSQSIFVDDSLKVSADQLPLQLGYREILKLQLSAGTQALIKLIKTIWSVDIQYTLEMKNIFDADFEEARKGHLVMTISRISEAP